MIEPTKLRKFAAYFPTGVTVVTSCDASGRYSGLTMNAVTSLSLDPPLYLACVDRRSNTLKAILESKVFGVAVLGQSQEKIARLFASKEKEKFRGLGVVVGQTGVPLLSDAVGWIECKLINSFPGGDHLILVGEVLSSCIRGGTPLLCFQGRFSPAHYSDAQGRHKGMVQGWIVLVKRLLRPILKRRRLSQPTNEPLRDTFSETVKRDWLTEIEIVSR